jgi:hypothetical protein
MWANFLVLTTAVCSVSAFVVQTNAPAKTFRPSNTLCHSAINTSNMWNGGNSYGKGQFKYYKDFDSWMSVFPKTTARRSEVFNLPKVSNSSTATRNCLEEFAGKVFKDW